MRKKLINIDTEIMSGIPVFNGTRVPIYILFDYIEGGEPLSVFLENYPSVSEDHAIKVLELINLRKILEEDDELLKKLAL